MSTINTQTATPTTFYLNGHWLTLLTAEGISLLSELFLIVLAVNNSPVFIILALFLDICLLSPLKAGVALLYDTVLADPENAFLRLLWRYYVHSYFKSVGWRLLTWIRMSFVTLACSVPVTVFSLLVSQTNDPLLALSFLLLRFFFVIAGVVVMILVSYRLSISIYLLSYSPTAKAAFQLDNYLFKGEGQRMWYPLKYSLCPPLRRLHQVLVTQQILKRKWSQALQDKEKHGIIDRI